MQPSLLQPLPVLPIPMLPPKPHAASPRKVEAPPRHLKPPPTETPILRPSTCPLLKPRTALSGSPRRATCRTWRTPPPTRLQRHRPQPRHIHHSHTVRTTCVHDVFHAVCDMSDMLPCGAIRTRRSGASGMKDASGRVVKPPPTVAPTPYIPAKRWPRHRISPRRGGHNAASPYPALGAKPGLPATPRPRHRVSLRRRGHNTLKPRSAVTETGPQPGMPDAPHAAGNPY